MATYEYKEKFHIRHCETDFKNHLKASVALSLMQEVACASAEELGFGYSYIHPRGYAFMVAGICFEFLRPIRLWENVVVSSWPLPPSFVVFGREYQFRSMAGEVLINASSRWCLIDMNTGKLAQSKAIEGQDYSTYNTAKTLENVQWKIPVFEREEGELRYTMTVGVADYDGNMHVNNTRYADYCIQCFCVDELKSVRLSRFQIAYVKQCKEGEVLRFFRKKVEENEYFVQGYNEKDEIVVQARLHFVADEEVHA